MVRIGTAGWSVPAQYAELAEGLTLGAGTHLERYARAMNCVEVNSSFYRSHRVTTWQRWADSVPEDFRFSVKFPKAITHGAKLAVAPNDLDTFFEEIAGLGEKLGPILVQLPPSLKFEDCPAGEFFEALRDRFDGVVALEPRHATWFTREVDELLVRHRISRVAADPARELARELRAVAGKVPKPGGWGGLAYFRLHGAPRTYYSNYEADYLKALAKVIRELPVATEVWVIFDNTAVGFAFANALELRGDLKDGQPAKRLDEFGERKS